ncbi:hypothetical protein Leryth_007699 [Lithospermum erythrorhizon]|nr:hypothetical protein Leryth_007699 [Lithospermum erythrorhizon]
MEQNNLEDKYFGVVIHSRVRKIKQEMEKINLWLLEQPEIKPQKRSRSPLGLARTISVGN